MCLLNLSPFLQSCYSQWVCLLFFLPNASVLNILSNSFLPIPSILCWGGLAEGVCLGSVLVECQLVDGTKVLQSAHSPGRRSSYCFLILFSVCIGYWWHRERTGGPSIAFVFLSVIIGQGIMSGVMEAYRSGILFGSLKSGRETENTSLWRTTRIQSWILNLHPFLTRWQTDRHASTPVLYNGRG